MNDRQRVRIKICGMTRLEDAMAAVEAGADALGFIFYSGSARYIDPADAKLIIEQLPPFVDIVGVFVDKKRKEVEEIVQYCRLNYVQLHGTESPKYCERLGRFASPGQVLKAFRVTPELTAEMIQPYIPHVQGFLLDTYKKDVVGGTGETFDWSFIDNLYLQKEFLLAGGLDVDNISSALQQVRPYGVDVSSGVETEPGIKDHSLIQQFVSRVRSYEAAASSG